MKTMKFSLLTFPKLFLYINVLLFLFLILVALIFGAGWAEIQARWEEMWKFFVYFFILVPYIFKQLFNARRLNYNPETRIFWVEKWAWFSWRIEHEFAHDELLGIRLLKSEGKSEIWLVNRQEQCCAFLGKTSDSQRAEILCEKIDCCTQLHCLSKTSYAIIRELEKKYFFRNKV